MYFERNQQNNTCKQKHKVLPLEPGQQNSIPSCPSVMYLFLMEDN